MRIYSYFEIKWSGVRLEDLTIHRKDKIWSQNAQMVVDLYHNDGAYANLVLHDEVDDFPWPTREIEYDVTEQVYVVDVGSDEELGYLLRHNKYYGLINRDSGWWLEEIRDPQVLDNCS